MAHQQTLPPDTELIGDFRIMELLGSGGFANTYLAMDLTLGREVAIKEFFPSELAVRADSQSVSVKSAAQQVQYDWAKGRFVREAKTLAKFRHPSVVRVFRVFNANDTAYIVLEFVRGANMETWLKRIQRRPDQDELDRFLPPLLDALEVVHEAGILHRDIKPANIYIREAEQTPVLLDFGAAKYATSTVGDQTATTAAIVSKGYSPHEAYSTDAKMQGPWTDIYGLAATVHRGLTGSAPLESTTRILQDDFVPLAERSELTGRYRVEFLSAIDQALAVMPKDRPQSISAWRSALYPGLVPSQADSAAQASPSQGRAAWQPLSDTPSDATTLYTGGSSYPSQSAAQSSPSGSTAPSGPLSQSTSVASSITEATRLAYNRVAKGQSRTVVTGWALAAAGAVGLAVPVVLNTLDGGKPEASAARTTPVQQEKPVVTASRQPASSKNDTMSTGEDPDVRAAMEKFEIERKKSRDRERETQRRQWERERLALQADLARRRAEEASKLAKRRAEERRAKEQETERKRLAKLTEEKRIREEQKKLEAERKAAELAAQQKAAAEAERERNRIAEAKAAEEREKKRIAEQKAEQERRAAEAKEREARLAAARAAREQERLRLARRAEAAERARAARDKKEELKVAALEPQPAVPTAPTPTATERKNYIIQMQTALKDGKCYTGALDGDVAQTEEALAKFNSGHKGQAKTIDVANASGDDYSAWLTWFRNLENAGCQPAKPKNEIADPSKSKKKKTYKAKSKPKSKAKKKTKSAKKKSTSKKRSKRARSKPSYGSGSTSNSLLRGTR